MGRAAGAESENRLGPKALEGLEQMWKQVVRRRGLRGGDALEEELA